MLQAVRRVFSRPSDPLAGIVFEVRTWEYFTRLVTIHVALSVLTISSLSLALLSHLTAAI